VFYFHIIPDETKVERRRRARVPASYIPNLCYRFIKMKLVRSSCTITQPSAM